MKQSMLLSTELIAARRVGDELRAALGDRQDEGEFTLYLYVYYWRY